MKKCRNCGADLVDGTVSVCPECRNETSAAENAYDGYYDDVLPPDADRIQDGIDTELIKKVAAVIIGVILVIAMCVAMLYVL